MGHAGPRLLPGPRGLARALRRRGALPAHVRAVGVFVGEQRVAAELGPMMRAAPDEDMRLFLCTQIADEARHVAFFNRFYTEVGVLEPSGSKSASPRPPSTSTPSSASCSTRCSGGASTGSPRSRGPRDPRRGRDDLPHGHRGHARPHGPALHHRLQRADGDAAGVREGLHAGRPRRASPCRVRGPLPARHGPRDPRHTEAIQRTLAEVAPVADGVLRPKWFDGSDDEPMLFGASVNETRAFALKALERRMKVIGLVAAA